MEERFTFPTVGAASEVEMIRVTPQWQLEYDAASVRLMGVYHITAKLSFEAGIGQMPDIDAVLIDDVDFDGVTGYFEYALPFTVDLPEQAGAPRLAVGEITTSIENQGLAINWDVSCQYAMLQPLSAFQTNDEKEEVAYQENPQSVQQFEQQDVYEVIDQTSIEEDDQTEFLQLNAEQVEKEENASALTLTSAPLIWDLKDTYSVKQYSLNQIIHE